MPTGTLAFFPWLRLKRRIDTNAFSLLPYDTRVAGEGNNVIRMILSRYTENNGRSVAEATLLQLRDKGLTDGLSEQELTFAFEAGEMVAFSGLACREFFGIAGFGYCNRTDFTLMVQQFRDEPRGVTIVSRRRDGQTMNLVPLEMVHFKRPYHCGARGPAELDLKLLHALLSARQGSHWDAYRDAIAAFNRANTDSPDVSEADELVATVGAFERLFDLRRGRADDLARALNDLMGRRVVDCTPCERLDRHARGDGRLRRGLSALEIWVDDLYRVRHKPAHGRPVSEVNPIWTMAEHLLLSAFLFPLVVKVKLESEGHYALTADDQKDLLALGHLFCCPRLLEPRKTQNGVQEWCWQRVRGDVSHQWAILRESLDRKDG